MECQLFLRLKSKKDNPALSWQDKSEALGADNGSS
jgi:hypothetical protein